MKSVELKMLMEAGLKQAKQIEDLRRDFIATATTLTAFAEAVALSHPDPQALKIQWDLQISEVTAMTEALFPGEKPTATEAKQHIDLILRDRARPS